MSLAILEFWLKGGWKILGIKGGSERVDHKKCRGNGYVNFELKLLNSKKIVIKEC